VGPVALPRAPEHRLGLVAAAERRQQVGAFHVGAAPGDRERRPALGPRGRHAVEGERALGGLPARRVGFHAVLGEHNLGGDLYQCFQNARRPNSLVERARPERAGEGHRGHADPCS
ncbi:MAG: hypothetical protein ACK55I_37980, partial [bacterium]